MVRTSRKLPKDWSKYKPVGNVVANTRLFAFKTPLCYPLARRYRKEDRFGVPDLYRELLFRGIQLGLVVNATNTERYYDSREIKNLDIEYKKLPASGRSFVGCEGIVKAFIKIVDDFLERNRDNDLLIGVHCTDGVNRAGYLICRYMVDRMGIDINSALNAFEISRDCTIERGSLVQALYRADRERKINNNRTMESDEDEEGLTDRERRRKKRRQKEVVADDSFDPHTMQEIQSLVKTIKQMKSEPQANNSACDSQEFTQLTMNSFSTSNISTTSIAFQSFQQQNRSTPTVNHSETSSPYVDSQNLEDEEDGSTPVDPSLGGQIDVRPPPSAAQSRRKRRKNLERKFNVMKRGQFWEIEQQRSN